MSALPRFKASVFALALAGMAGAGQPTPDPTVASQPGALNTLAILPLRGAFNVPKANPGQPPAGSPRPAPEAGPGPLLALEDQLDQRVTMAFFHTGRFQLIERAQLASVLKEGRLEQSGLVDDRTAARLGRQLGAAYVLVGSYTGGLGHVTELKTSFFGTRSRKDSFPGHLEARLRLVGTEDGTIREPFLVHATSSDPAYYHSYELLLDDFSRNLAREVATRYPLTGYVIKLLSEREALVDLGRRQGLEKGAGFELVEQGADVVHPVTGKPVQGERRVLTRMQATEVGEESSTLKVVGPGAVLRLGQTVVRVD